MESLDLGGDALARRPRRWLFVAVVGLVLLVGGGLLVRATQRLTVSYQVPADYRGYLVTRWECPAGERLPSANVLTGQWHSQLAYRPDGTLCIADSIPSPGFIVRGFHFPDGQEAPVIIGGTRSRQGDARRSDHEFVYSLASLGIGTGRQLGDECSLDEFLEDRFGKLEWTKAHACEPIWVTRGAGAAGTPVVGSPSVR